MGSGIITEEIQRNFTVYICNPYPCTENDLKGKCCKDKSPSDNEHFQHLYRDPVSSSRGTTVGDVQVGIIISLSDMNVFHVGIWSKVPQILVFDAATL